MHAEHTTIKNIYYFVIYVITRLDEHRDIITAWQIVLIQLKLKFLQHVPVSFEHVLVLIIGNDYLTNIT